MPKFCSSSNPAKLVLARLSAIHSLKKYPHSYAEIVKKYMREDDPEILETIYKYGVDYIAKIPDPNKEGIVEVLRQSSDLKAKSAAPESFMDDSLVRELAQRGQYR
jgi:hypothetical protein